jgi:hypothetical protein
MNFRLRIAPFDIHVSVSGFCAQSRPPSKVTRTQRVMLSVVKRESCYTLVFNQSIRWYIWLTSQDSLRYPISPGWTPNNFQWDLSQRR